MPSSNLYKLPLPIITLLLSISSLAQTTTYTPTTGSPERKQILEALRTPVEGELKRKVVFKVEHLKVQGKWAFMRGVPQQPGGKAMQYKGTEYQRAIEAGAFDDWICALMQKQKGKWRVIRYVIGATDVVYEGWEKEFRAPSGIFN
jgi:hypothetical protein